MRWRMWIGVGLVVLMATVASAELPDYEGNLQLQVRSNIVDGYNLPANSSFNSKTPSLADTGHVAVSLGVVAGDVDTVGLWLGGSGTGSVAWSDGGGALISDCSLNDADQIIVCDESGACTVLVEDVDSYPVSPFSSFANSVSLTNTEWVAFNAGLVAGGSGVFLTNGFLTLAIATTAMPEITAIDAFGPSANDHGQVVFRAFDGTMMLER